MATVQELHNKTNQEIIKRVSETLTQIYNSGLGYNELIDTAIKNFQAESCTEYDLEQVLDIDFGDFIATFRKTKELRYIQIFLKSRFKGC